MEFSLNGRTSFVILKELIEMAHPESANMQYPCWQIQKFQPLNAIPNLLAS